MSLVGTLAKVAAGALVARGVGKIVQNRSGGGGQSGGGLGGMLGGMLGGGQQGGGGLGDMMGGMLGGGREGGSAMQGGLGGMLGGMLSGGQQSGGLGGLLESLGAGGAQPTAPGQPDPQPQQGGLGDMLNSAFDKYGEPPQQPSHDQEEQAKLLLRAMISAAKSDGQIDPQEKQQIMDQLQDADADDIAFVRQELSAPVDVQGLAADTPESMAQQVYLMSLMAINLDQQSEARYLGQLAQALSLSPQVCNMIHDQVGAPQIFS